MKKTGKINKINLGLLSDGDIKKIGNLLDNRLVPIETRLDLMATKEDLESTETRIKSQLKEYIHEGVETIMDGMDKLAEQLSEKERVNRLEQVITKIAGKVGVEIK